MTDTATAAVATYLPAGSEVDIFRTAFQQRMPVLLKGPTGCGKTRLVEHMAEQLGLPLYTVSCHEDVTSADLIGKHVLVGGQTEWIDGPLTRAVREGGICYLDEIVEARQDATVAIHSLTDHRRELFIERLGGIKLKAPDTFCLVVSYNPGYQSVLKDLKTSTRQRMVSITLNYPAPEVEREIIGIEGLVPPAVAQALVRLGQALRRVDDPGLREVPSTRLLVDAAKLIAGGLAPRVAVRAAIIETLTDDLALADALESTSEMYFAGSHILGTDGRRYDDGEGRYLP
ncbi:AAA family ATPase [Nocardia sp. R16R-3T]